MFTKHARFVYFAFACLFVIKRLAIFRNAHASRAIVIFNGKKIIAKNKLVVAFSYSYILIFSFFVVFYIFAFVQKKVQLHFCNFKLRKTQHKNFCWRWSFFCEKKRSFHFSISTQILKNLSPIYFLIFNFCFCFFVFVFSFSFPIEFFPKLKISARKKNGLPFCFCFFIFVFSFFISFHFSIEFFKFARLGSLSVFCF